MKKKFTISIILIILILVIIKIGIKFYTEIYYDKQVEKANELVVEKKFDKAIEVYNKILAKNSDKEIQKKKENAEKIKKFYNDGTFIYSEEEKSKYKISKNEAAIIINMTTDIEKEVTPKELKKYKNIDNNKIYYGANVNLKLAMTGEVTPYYILVDVNTGNHEGYGPESKEFFEKNYEIIK